MNAFILETPDGLYEGRNFTNDPDAEIKLFRTQRAAEFTADVLKLKHYVVHPVLLNVTVKFLGRAWPCCRPQKRDAA